MLKASESPLDMWLKITYFINAYAYILVGFCPMTLEVLNPSAAGVLELGKAFITD